MSTWTRDDAKRFARQGWEASLRRIRPAWEARDAEACMVALYEALTWARALDEGLGQDRPGRPQILDGVRFARNRALHSLVLLVEPQPRAVWPETWPETWPERVLTWVHFDQIDRPASEHYDEKVVLAFEHYLQTRPVLDTMLDVDKALAEPPPLG